MLTSSQVKRSGFAVVTALLLASFVTVLVVVFSSLVVVESRVAGNHLEMAKARMNALLGMRLAMGQLQAQMGPDRRISASASLSTETDSSKLEWVGVWDSDPTSSSYGQRLRWLVSIDESSAQADGAIEVAGADLVRLERVKGDNNGGDGDYVRLPLNPIQGAALSQLRGQYAWWIDDEGAKARINPANVSEGSEGSHLARHMAANTALGDSFFSTLSVRQPGVAGLSGFDSGAFSAASLEGLQIVTDHGQLELALSSFVSDDSELFDEEDVALRRNFSLHSAGVLVDVRKGGLKKNLTAAFNDDQEFLKLLNDAGVSWDGESIFDQLNPGASPEEDLGGPKWAQMRSFFKQGDDLNPDGSIMMVLPDTDGAAEDLDEVSAVTPVLALAQMTMRGGIYHDGSGNYEPVIIAHPAVSLWNPYNRPLDTGQDLYVEFCMIDADPLDDRYRDWTIIGYDIQAGDDGPYLQRSWLPNDTFGKRWLRFTIPRTTIPAGRTRIFAASQNAELVFNGDGQADAVQNILDDDYFDGYGFYVRTGANFGLSDGQLQSDLKFRFKSREKTHSEDRFQRKTTKFHWNIATDPSFESGHVQIVPTHCKYASLGWGGDDKIANGTWARDPVFSDFSASAPTPQWGDLGELAYKFYRTFSEAAYDGDVHNPLRVQWIAHNNPRATYYGAGYYKSRGRVPPHAENFAYVGILTNGSPELDIQLNSDFTGTPVGFSMGANGNDEAVLYELPSSEVPFVSLGQLGMTNFSRIHGIGGYPSGDGWEYLYDSTQQAFPLGNSILDPRLPKGETSMTWANNPKTTSKETPQGTHFDYSYFLNEALWDRFFLSSESGSVSTLANGEEEVVFPLSNPRFKASKDDTVFYNDLRDYDTTAASLLVEGAFNVNSTKVEAWESLLHSFYGQSVQVRDLENPDSLTSESHESRSPFARFGLPAGAVSVTSDNSTSDAVYLGYRSLTDSQISALAQAIVNEIEARRADGRPFLSLGEFINRDPSSATAGHQIRGVLQAAIETVDAGGDSINGHLQADTDLLTPESFDIGTGFSGNSWNYGDNPAEMEGSTLKGAPGYFLQSDLLTKIAPVLSARSDTFRIRSYGNSLGLNGERISEAWCEVVVQRRPDYVDAESDLPEMAPDALISEVNAKFGRRFIIKSFKWLTEEEI